MAKKNSRKALLQLASTLGGPYTNVNGTHGLQIAMPVNFSDSTSHGDDVESSTPGTRGFNLTLKAWYDTVETTLQAMSVGRISEYFRAYYDRDNPLDYYRGQIFLVQEEDNLDLNTTIDQGYAGRVANADFQIIRNGAAL